MSKEKRSVVEKEAKRSRTEKHKEIITDRALILRRKKWY